MVGYINYQLLDAGSDLGGRSVGNERRTSSVQAVMQSEE
jgi:hypothetical protein